MIVLQIDITLGISNDTENYDKKWLGISVGAVDGVDMCASENILCAQYCDVYWQKQGSFILTIWLCNHDSFLSTDHYLIIKRCQNSEYNGRTEAHPKWAQQVGFSIVMYNSTLTTTPFCLLCLVIFIIIIAKIEQNISVIN